MSTRSAARKAEPWSSFLYSDPEGFRVKTVQFANGATGRGLFANRSFDDKEFLLTCCGPRSTTKTSNFDYVMELQEGKQRYSLTLLTKRIQEWLDSSTTRTEQWLLIVG